MTNNITDYYNDIIMEYPAYKDSILYQIIIALIQETYLKNSFTDDIQDLLNISNCVLDDKLIDSVLINNGFDIYLIFKISKLDKLKIISGCIDVNSYKGSVKCLQKILDCFDYNIDLYNLYLLDNTNFNFYPKLLCSQSKLSQKALQLSNPVTINNPVNFLIGSNSTNLMYNKSIYPIKTNLILLNNSVYTNENIMNLYIGIGVLRHYSNYDILLKLDFDKVYKTDIKTTFLILYYLHSFESTTKTIISSAISSDNMLFDFDITDIPQLSNYVSNINSNNAIIDFINTFLTPIYSEMNITSVNYSTKLSDIKTYLDSFSDNKILIENILDSLNLWLDSIDISHTNYLLNLIPMYKKYIEVSTPYKLLSYFKQLSNQFVFNESKIVTINNKLSNIFIDEVIEINR